MIESSEKLDINIPPTSLLALWDRSYHLCSIGLHFKSEYLSDLPNTRNNHREPCNQAYNCWSRKYMSCRMVASDMLQNTPCPSGEHRRSLIDWMEWNTFPDLRHHSVRQHSKQFRRSQFQLSSISNMQELFLKERTNEDSASWKSVQALLNTQTEFLMGTESFPPLEIN